MCKGLEAGTDACLGRMDRKHGVRGEANQGGQKCVQRSWEKHLVFKA